jgi:hypothetical protein
MRRIIATTAAALTATVAVAGPTSAGPLAAGDPGVSHGPSVVALTHDLSTPAVYHDF